MSANQNVPVAGVVLRDDQGRYLLVQEKKPMAYGLWNLPAGWIDEGETLQQAAVREAKEETGFDVELISEEPLLSAPNDKNDRQLNSFRARVVGGKLEIQEEELLDVQWLSLDQINELDRAGKIRDAWVISSIIKSAEA